MANAMFIWPIYSDVGVSYTPTFTGGAWYAALPKTNMQDRRIHKVARALSARESDTRFRCDLGVDRDIRGVVLPKSNLSTSAKWRVIGVPSTMLFDYESGMELAPLNGTFSRTPTAGTLAATYYDHNGLVQNAGENRFLRSEAFDNASWTKSNVTVSADSVAGPLDSSGTTADTLTATNANGTVLQSVTTTAVSWTVSVFLKRLTGSGNIQLTADGTNYSTVTVTSDWQRFSLTQTGTAGATNIGIRIVTSGDAVYAWGAQAEIGSSAKSYLTTTSASVSAIRDSHYTSISGVRTTLIEPTCTNLCLQSEDLGTTWAAVGSPTRSAAAGTCGVVNLDLIGDDDGAALEGYTQTITYTADAVKAVSFFIRQGTSTSTMIRLRDTSAGADRLLVAVTWSGGLPVVTATTGTALGYQTLADASGNAVFRILLKSASVTAANTNSLQIYPASDAALATANTGTVYVGGFLTCNQPSPCSYIKTTTGTVARAADVLTFTWAGGNPAAMSAYIDLTDAGGSTQTAAGTYLWLGAANTNDPHFEMGLSSSQRERTGHDNNVDAQVNSDASSAVSYGQRVEHLGTLASTGAVQTTKAVDGGTATAASASSAPAAGLSAAWAGSVLTIGSNGAGASGLPLAIRSIRIVSGVQTMAYMQAVVSDSGWLDAWPSGIDAEESYGMNIPAVRVLSTAFSARYWSIQLRDPTNSAGYLQLGRLVIGGGFQPGKNFALGSELGIETQSTRERNPSGVAYYDDQPRYRRTTVVFENVPETEAFVSHHRFQRIAGIHGQFYWVQNPDDTTYMMDRSYLATLEQLRGVRAVLYNNYGVAYDIVEEL